jgi:cell division protein FtsA
MGDTFRSRMNGSKANGVRALQARTGLVAALDVGSSKIVCLIGKADGGVLRVLGAAVHESRGIRSGLVTSLEAAEQSIREAVDAAERKADHRIQDVILSVQCGQPKSLKGAAAINLGGRLVNDLHLRQVIAEAKANCRDEGYETIQASPTAYLVDQSRGIADPRGMFCDRLGVAVHAVAVRLGPLQNLRLAVEGCHLTIARQLFAPYASGLATLAADELALGVTLVDMGAGCTSIAVFAEDELVHVDSVPIGGAHVTADIAKTLSTPLTAAERIKSLYGTALGGMDGGADTIEVPLMGEQGERGRDRIRRSALTGIIQARIEEILSEVQARLRKSGYDVSVGRRMVLTGGASQLAGVRELTGTMLGKQVRLAAPQALAGLAGASAGPAYATALGLLIAGATSPAELTDPNPQFEIRPQRRGAVARWFDASLFGS